MFYGLVGRAVFAQADGVVGEDIDDLLLHQRAKAQGGTHVVGEYQEGGSVGDCAAVDSDAIADGAHSVFAHAEVEIASVEVTRANVALAVQDGQRRGGQVGGAANKIGDGSRDGVHNLAGGLAG